MRAEGLERIVALHDPLTSYNSSSPYCYMSYLINMNIKTIGKNEFLGIPTRHGITHTINIKTTWKWMLSGKQLSIAPNRKSFKYYVDFNIDESCYRVGPLLEPNTVNTLMTMFGWQEDGVRTVDVGKETFLSITQLDVNGQRYSYTFNINCIERVRIEEVNVFVRWVNNSETYFNTKLSIGQDIKLEESDLKVLSSILS